MSTSLKPVLARLGRGESLSTAESEEAFARRAVRRKRLFLKLSVASLIVAAGFGSN